MLLGESGVGKSTFINALVNYLIFDTLQQAEHSKPVVLIPVSFLTTVGDHFDEVIVKFGDLDANEDHEHQGQSVTQYCRSYVFHLSDRFILRLIDSPGMGDTRGIAQDERNMEHILSYVDNLSHLNAICLLLKPNASRLNVFLRSCINQLFTYLTPNGYDNIIFCFTNSRATFFAPGDTGPLLRRMLQDEQHGGIPFGKANTFCFDSESFRYLAARKCGVKFDDFQKEECTNSWRTSVVESVRLLQYILERKPYHLGEYSSLRKTAMEIAIIARPLMETLRLIICKQILCERGMMNRRMELNCDPVDTELCSSCALSEIVELKPFFFMKFKCVQSESSASRGHQCSSDKSNFLIEYTVKHGLVPESQNSTREYFHRKFHDMLFKYDQLMYFLQKQGLSLETDPFTTVLERLINEEEHILCSHPSEVTLNKSLKEILISIESIRMVNRTRLNQSNEILSLGQVCQIMNDLKSYDFMRKQIDAIRQSRRSKMKTSEKQITTNSDFHNKLFTQLINSFQ